MGKELSAGFDIAGVFSEATITRVFQLAYYAGLLPLHAHTDFSDQTGDHALELYFLPPSLEFVTLPNVNNPVKLRFPFLAQVPTMNAQRAGAIVVFVTASKLQDLDENDKPFNYVVLDFSTVPVTQFQYEPEPSPQLPLAAAITFGTLDEGIVTAIAAPLAKEVLAGGISQIPITPQVPSGFGFFTFRTYVDDDFKLPADGTPYVLPRVLGAYVNVANVPRDPPASPPLQLWRHVIPNPHTVGYIWAGADELKVALPETLVNASLDAALEEKGLKPLPATLTTADDEEVTINALAVTLANGHVHVTGDADDVEFTVKIALAFENDQLKSVVIDKDFDVPWYLDFAQVFLPPLGAAIFHSVELSIAKGLDSIGSTAGDLLGNVNVFSNQLPGVSLAQLRIHNDGDVGISPAGLVLPGQLETLLGAGEIEQPFYVYGHLESHEFHRRGQGCPYLEKMKPKNTILFLSPAKALSMGYNGCRACYLDYDVPSAGRILLYYRDPNPSAPEGQRKVHLAFELLDPMNVGGEEVKPQVEWDRTYKARLKDDGLVYFSDAGLPDFFPGKWRLEVKSGPWSTTCEVLVKKWGKFSGKNTHLALTVGVQSCGMAFGTMPAYPG